MNKGIFYTLFAITLIIAASLRAYNLENLPPGLYPDEAMNGNNALEAIKTGDWKLFYPENNGREGLFINIQGLSLIAFEVNEPWVLRIVSVVFGFMTVLGIYFITRELFRSKKIPDTPPGKITREKMIALLAMFLTAVSFWHIMFSRIGFRAISAPFFLTWSFFFLLMAVRPDIEKLKSYSYVIIGGLLYGLGFHTYIAYRITPVLIAILFATLIIQEKVRLKEFIIKFAIFTAVVLVAFAPLGIYFLSHPADFSGRVAQVSVFNQPDAISRIAKNTLLSLNMFVFHGDNNERHNLSGNPELDPIAAIFFVIGFIASCMIIGRLIISKEKKTDYIVPASVLLFWLLLGIAPAIIADEGVPHALRSILAIPPAMILAAWGAVLLFDKIYPWISISALRKRSVIAVISVLAILLVADTAYTYFYIWGPSKSTYDAFAGDYVAIGRTINALPASAPKCVLISAGGTDVRGFPTPAETVMFITDSFTPDKQSAKNIRYFLPKNKDNIPADCHVFEIR